MAVSSMWRWAVASNERAVANARGAATECSRLRVERAEIEQFLLEHEASIVEVTAKAASAGR